MKSHILLLLDYKMHLWLFIVLIILNVECGQSTSLGPLLMLPISGLISDAHAHTHVPAHMLQGQRKE
jgi:hypothetical protein